MLRVAFELFPKTLEVSECLLSGRYLIARLGPSREEFAQELFLSRFRIHHQVVNQRPGFRVKDGGPVCFVVVRRTITHFEQSFYRQKLVLAQNIQVSGIDRSRFAFLFTQSRIAKKLRKALPKPEGEPVEIDPQQSVRVLMVESVKRIFSLRVESQHHVVFVLPRLVHAGVMDVSFHLPLFGEQLLHRRLIFGSEDHDRLREVHLERGERRMEHRANLLELVRHFPRFFLARVGRHRKVRTPDFDPIVGSAR